jgi:methyl coenzyme M reductase gamma subunit
MTAGFATFFRWETDRQNLIRLLTHKKPGDDYRRVFVVCREGLVS